MTIEERRYDAYNQTVYTYDEFIMDCLPGLPNEFMLRDQWLQLPIVKITFDSTAETLKHIRRVNTLLLEAATELLRRAAIHDESKLHDPEKPLFDKYTPLLAGIEYGTPEYFEALRGLKPALDHHYAANSHHPEHYQGVDGMDLFDVLEMLMDWRAASERDKDGSIQKSLPFNKERFKIDDQLFHILENTVAKLWPAAQ